MVLGRQWKVGAGRAKSWLLWELGEIDSSSGGEGQHCAGDILGIQSGGVLEEGDGGKWAGQESSCLPPALWSVEQFSEIRSFVHPTNVYWGHTLCRYCSRCQEL